VDIYNPKSKIEQAISVYYDSLIEYVVEQFIKLYNSTNKKELPNINQPIDIVVAGGTSLAGGFIKKMKEKIDGEFPIPVGNIKHASDPLFSVSKGLLVAAEVSTDG